MNSISEKLINEVSKGLYWTESHNFLTARMPKGLISNFDDAADVDTSIL